MDNPIQTFLAVAASELRTARRLVRTWVFAVLAVGLNLAIFGFYGYVEASYSPGATGRSSPHLLMGQFGTYLLTTVLAGVVFLGVDARARNDRVGMTETLDSRPLPNHVLVGGQVVGLALTAWLAVLVALGAVQAWGAIAAGLWGWGDPVEPVSLAAFAFVDTLPTLLLWCSVVMVFVVAMRNRLVAATAALVLLGSVVWFAPRTPVYLLGALVPVTDFADSGSDLAPRFADVEALLQRGSMLVVAVGLVALAAGLHPRLDTRVRSRQLVCGVLIVAVGVSGIVFLVGRAIGGIELRETWLAVHSRAAGEQATTRADIEKLTGNVAIEPGERLAIEVTAILRATSSYEGAEGPVSSDLDELTLALNPGLRVTALRMDGAEAAFTHRHGLLSVALSPPLRAGSRAALSLRAAGVPDSRFAYLDGAVDPLKVAASNRLGVLGREAAIFDESYVALMPAVHWLPSAGANVHRDDPARGTRDFFEVDLSVRVPDNWLVVAVGRRQRMEPGSFRFESRVPVSEVGLFASRFTRQAVEADGVQYEVLVHDSHAQYGDLLTGAGGVLRPHLGEIQRRLENLGIGYPFDSLSIVEVPMRLRTYRGGGRLETDRGPPSVMILKENEIPALQWRHRTLSRYFTGLDDADLMLTWLWNLVDDFNILHKYASNLLAVTAARDEGATALDVVCQELGVALLLGETLQYLEVPNSAHAKDSEDALGSVIGGMLGFFTGDRAPLFGHTMSFADRPHVWERALDMPLSNLEASGDARSAVEVLTLKGTRAAHAVLDRFGRERVGELLAGLRDGFAGRTYRAQEFEAIGASVGASAESILGNWLNSKGAPGFLASPVEVVRLADDDVGDRRYQVRVHVRNDESMAGAVFLGVDRQAWMERTDAFPVPGHTSVELGMVTSEPPSQLWLHSYFSRNRIPLRLELPAEADHAATESEELVGLAPSDWRPATPAGIVIDDLDPGFSLEGDEDPESQGGIMSRYQPSLPLDRGLPQYSWMTGSRPGGMWLRQEVPSGWGKYRHTIVRATPGVGDRRLLFATELVTGRWQLDFHIPHDPLPQLPGEAYVEPSFIGQLGGYDMWVRTAEGDLTVEFDGSAAAPGWNRLGTFDLEGGSVTLVVSNRTTGGIAIADAVRWLPVSSAENR